MLDHQLLQERVNSNVSKDEDWNSESSDTPYQIDRARIIHSASFRRLQAKTQILGIGDSDFYRTRLTHSLEVAQLGFGITESLKSRYKDDPLIDLIPSQNAIESICLAHDIGHPAFGHGGEVALNYCMINDGGFEGNGQTLRIVSKLAEYTPENGMNLTRRTLLGLIKYPIPYSKFNLPYPEKKQDQNLNIPLQLTDYYPPKCILDTEDDLFTKWVAKIFSEADLSKLMTINPKKKTKPLYTSFDSSIMELADDISYGIHDLEDAVALKLVNENQWREQVVSAIKNINVELNNDLEEITKLLFGLTNRDRKHAISKLIRYFLKKAHISKQNLFEHPLLDYNAGLEDEENTKALEIIKTFVINNVIKQPEIQILDYKGQKIVVELFEVLSNNPKNLLPSSTLQQYEKAENKNRIICDYISGMTDAYASRLYHKLFTPNMGSVFDRL
jgi:dGTPase